jgi:hypothetical protein
MDKKLEQMGEDSESVMLRRREGTGRFLAESLG